MKSDYSTFDSGRVGSYMQQSIVIHPRTHQSSFPTSGDGGDMDFPCCHKWQFPYHLAQNVLENPPPVGQQFGNCTTVYFQMERWNYKVSVVFATRNMGKQTNFNFSFAPGTEPVSLWDCFCSEFSQPKWYMTSQGNQQHHNQSWAQLYLVCHTDTSELLPGEL